MNLKDSNMIGKGGHWIVKRITPIANGQNVSVVRKSSKGGDVDTNITLFELVLKAGLPTLKKYIKINEGEIEAEDLNADISHGYFVSPNTVRGYSTCGDILLKITKFETPTQVEYKQCNEFDFNEIIKRIQEKGIDEVEKDGTFEQLRNKKVVIGAEGEVYNNRVSNISNLDSFWLHAKNDMENASKSNLRLFTDAFFFKVNPNNGEIEYKIADFDCIQKLSDSEISYDDLRNSNIEYLKDALCEYVLFFVIEEKYDEYIKLIKDLQ